jgi:hypothetical protein
MQGANAAVQAVYDLMLTEIKDDLEPQPLEPEYVTNFFDFIKDYEQELSFFFCVCAPCLLIHQISPYRLYRNAASGNVDAIEKLLKIDPLMLHDPTIGQHIQALRFSNRTNDYERLIAATLKLAVMNHREIEAARNRSKVEIAAFISEFCQALGLPVTPPQITALFNAYAKDKGVDDYDPDLPFDESFNKAIKRHSLRWHNLFHFPDNHK